MEFGPGGDSPGSHSRGRGRAKRPGKHETGALEQAERLKMKQTQLQGSVEGKTQAPTLHRGIQTQSQRDRSVTAPVTLLQPHGWRRSMERGPRRAGKAQTRAHGGSPVSGMFQRAGAFGALGKATALPGHGKHTQREETEILPWHSRAAREKNPSLKQADNALAHFMCLV